MAMTEEKRLNKAPHNLIMEDRRKVMISGVLDVDSFDEQAVILMTDMGELTVRGTALHISRFNVETGELNMDGNVIALVYSEQQKQGNFFGRLFR